MESNSSRISRGRSDYNQIAVANQTFRGGWRREFFRAFTENPPALKTAGATRAGNWVAATGCAALHYFLSLSFFPRLKKPPIFLKAFPTLLPFLSSFSTELLSFFFPLEDPFSAVD